MAEALRQVVGRLVLADGIVPGRIAVEDGWIAGVIEDPSDAEAAAGPLIAPGFIDVHVHGWGGHDATGDAAALSGMARALLRQGVTSFLPTAPTLAEAELPRFADRVRDWMPAAQAMARSRSGSTWRGRSSPRPGRGPTIPRCCARRRTSRPRPSRPCSRGCGS